MSKRRISKQQFARIQKIQTNYQQKNQNHESAPLKNGLVLSRFSRDAKIEDPQGNRIHCSIRPNIRSLVAGDRVLWQQVGEAQGVVVSCYPRHSILSRPTKHGAFKVIAANVTQMIVVVAVKPEITWPLLDSYLVMADYLKLEVCIVLNKIDLPCETFKQELVTYNKVLGYPVLFITKKNSQGYDLLKQTLKHHTSVFVGQSGVGKSSIIAEILPHENTIQVAEISSGSDLGCHTTSNSQFYHLPDGGALIDSPGVREFGLGHIAVSDIIQGYREFRPYISHCRFRNCNHMDSPGCAIINAVSRGDLTEKRYRSLIKNLLQLTQ